MNIPVKYRLTDIENRWGCQGGGWRREELGVWKQQMQTIIRRTGKQGPPA